MKSISIHRCAAALVAVLCWTSSNGQSLTPQSAEQADAPSQRVLPTWIEVSGGAWQVPPQLVREMAKRLQEGSAHADLRKMATYRRPLVQLSDYTIQYQGELNDGARSVRILGNCHGHDQSDEMLAKKFLIIMDEGACLFDAVYSPSENRFISFEFHGLA